MKQQENVLGLVKYGSLHYEKLHGDKEGISSVRVNDQYRIEFTEGMEAGKRSLSPELAMMMEAALGVDAAPLLAMQNEYDILMAERDASFMEKLKQIRRIAAIF